MKDEKAQPTFYVHDYETFGISPAYDRPAQFAGIRTDADFNIVAEPQIVYCKPANDYLPDPDAVMITGITPQEAQRKGVVEAEFTQQIHDQFSHPNTCIVGYNNVRFDDEVSRNLFYRNFFDPYAYSWQQGNSRWDLLDVMRACYALRPEGIEWPLNEDGLPSFRLEHLTKANGVEHSHAHDAMSDVYATIAMAKLVKQAQPKLFDYLYQHRGKRKIETLIDIVNMAPLVHVSGMFGAQRGNTSWVAPLAWHPEMKTAVIVCDLAGDMSPLLELDADTLRERLYTRRDELPSGQSPVPLKLIHTNKCPVLAPAKTLLPENAERLNIDRQRCLKNLQLLKEHPEVREKVVAVFGQPAEFPPISDVDGRLYDGFFSDADRTAIGIIRQTKPENLPARELSFNDDRLAPLLFRYRARNYPHTLDDGELQRWHAHRQAVLTQERLLAYAEKIEALAQQHADSEEKITLLKQLYLYAQKLVG